MKKSVTADISSPMELTNAQIQQLQALEGRTPDLGDIPEAAAENWQRVRRFYKPKKAPISIRLDADVLDWLERKSERYQIEINRILRKEMDADVCD